MTSTRMASLSGATTTGIRFIVAPEDAAVLTDIKAFTRDLMADAERDLGTRLDWVAVDHWNTEHPTSMSSCAAGLTRGRIWSFRATTSARACARGPRAF